MKQKLLISFLFISITIIQNGCFNEKANDNDQVLIRMKNSSDFVYKDLIINSAGEEKKTIEKITPHQSTDYLNFENAYRYAFVELKINGDTFTIQPIDYLGEEKLDPGRYTYEIKAKDSGTRYNRLDLVLNKN